MPLIKSAYDFRVFVVYYVIACELCNLLLLLLLMNQLLLILSRCLLCFMSFTDAMLLSGTINSAAYKAMDQCLRNFGNVK